VMLPIWHERTIFFPRRQPRTSVEYRRGAEARQASIQTRKILRMQWRPVLIVFMIVLNVVLLSTVFLEAEGMYTYPTERFLPWIACLIENGKDKCMLEADKLGPAENLIVAIIILLAICGLWGVVLVFRSSMLFGWIDLLRGTPRSKLETLMPKPTHSSAIRHGQGLATQTASCLVYQSTSAWLRYPRTLIQTIPTSCLSRTTMSPSIAFPALSGQRLHTFHQAIGETILLRYRI